MRSKTLYQHLHQRSSFPQGLREDIEKICNSKDISQACKEHEGSPGSKLLDKFFKDQLLSRGYSVTSDNLRVADKCKFDIDLLITSSDWQAAVSIEGGQAARVDLDLIKFIAWAKKLKSSDVGYAILIGSDKKLSRNITGTTNEAAFDYLERLFPLFHATNPNITDLLVVEFKR